MTRSLRFPTLLLMAALVATACGGAGGPGASPAGGSPAASGSASGGPVTSGAAGEISVLSLWGGSEEEAFKAVLEDFTAKTGWGVKYEADRQTYATTLQSRITGGNPPDIAIIPGIGFLRRFAKDGSLQKIADLGVDTTCMHSPRSTTTRARCGSAPMSSVRPASRRGRPGMSSRPPSRK